VRKVARVHVRSPYRNSWLHKESAGSSSVARSHRRRGFESRQHDSSSDPGASIAGALAGTFSTTQHEIIYIYAVILGLHALLNIFSVRLVALLNTSRLVQRSPACSSSSASSSSSRATTSRLRRCSRRRSHNSGFSHHSSLIFVFRSSCSGCSGAIHPSPARRLGAHERGDPERVALGGAGRNHVDRRLGGLRLHSSARVTFASRASVRRRRGAPSGQGLFLSSLGRDGRGDALHHRMAQLYCGMTRSPPPRGDVTLLPRRSDARTPGSGAS